MTRYIIRRVLWLIPVLFVVSIVTFILMHLAPGGPWDREGKELPPAVQDKLNAQFHLDLPLHEQYFALYVGGDHSPRPRPLLPRPNQNVTEVIARGLPYTFRLGIQALLLSVLSACRRHHRGVAPE